MRKNQKKVVIFMPFIDVGGVEKNLFLISNYLVKNIENLSICTTSNNYRKKFDKKISFITPKKKISEKISKRVKYFICLFLLFKLFLKDKNYLLFSFQANIYCILLCRIFKIKIIVRSNSSPTGWSHNFLKRFIYKKIISLSDEIIVNSNDFKKEMDKKFNIKTNCIFNPLDKLSIDLKSKKKVTNNFFRKKYLNIINVGRLTEQKDQITILRSVKELKDKIKIRLIIIGEGIEERNLREYIKKNHLNKQVRIYHSTTNPFKYIRSADIFVLSSKYEGLPNVLLEAAYLKKFIISSDCPTGPREILQKGQNGLLFEVGNYKDLQNKIIFYLKNKRSLNKKTNNLYKSLSRYDLDNNLKKYLNTIMKFI